MKSSAFLSAVVGGLAICSVAWAQTTDGRPADILRQAKAYQFELRNGRTENIGNSIAMLESATNKHPHDADLWNAMGAAYLARTTEILISGKGFAELGPLFQKSQAALERALAIKPDHAEALAAHGGLRAALAAGSRQPDQAAKGVDEMNRAVALAPHSTPVRLQRAFSGLNLPDALRNRSAEAEDLDYLTRTTNEQQSRDFLQLLRADLHFETGESALAKELYRLVSRSSSPLASRAEARLAALERGDVATADIKKLRADTINCSMCHGQR